MRSRSTCIVVDNVVGNALESMHNTLLIQGDDYQSLPKHIEALKHRHEALEDTGFEVSSTKFRDAYTEELVNC